MENEVNLGIRTPCTKNRLMDEAGFYSNLQLDGGPHLIAITAEAKVFNFYLCALSANMAADPLLAEVGSRDTVG